MKAVLIILALVAGGFVLWLCFGSGGAPAKPGAPAGPGLVDGIQVQLDARVRISLALKLGQQRNQLKQLAAMEPVDQELAKAQLKSFDELVAEIESGKHELVTRGTEAKEFDDWLEKHNWAEIQELAKELRTKIAAE